MIKMMTNPNAATNNFFTQGKNKLQLHSSKVHLSGSGLQMYQAKQITTITSDSDKALYCEHTDIF